MTHAIRTRAPLEPMLLNILRTDPTRTWRTREVYEAVPEAEGYTYDKVARKLKELSSPYNYGMVQRVRHGHYRWDGPQPVVSVPDGADLEILCPWMGCDGP